MFPTQIFAWADPPVGGEVKRKFERNTWQRPLATQRSWVARGRRQVGRGDAGF